MVSYHRTRRSRSALAYGSRSTAAAETTSTGSYTTSWDATAPQSFYAAPLRENRTIANDTERRGETTSCARGVRAHARPAPDSSANQPKSRRFPYDINSGRCETSLNADIVRAIQNPRFPG